MNRNRWKAVAILALCVLFGLSRGDIMIFPLGVKFGLFEIVLLMTASGMVAAIAKRRGGNGGRWGGTAFAGYIAVKILVVEFDLLAGPGYESDGFNFFQNLIAAAWVAATWLAARFWLGRGKEKPGQKWNCPSCNSLNQEDAVVCETCGVPYKDPAENGGLPL